MIEIVEGINKGGGDCFSISILDLILTFRTKEFLILSIQN